MAMGVPPDRMPKRMEGEAVREIRAAVHTCRVVMSHLDLESCRKTHLTIYILRVIVKLFLSLVGVQRSLREGKSGRSTWAVLALDCQIVGLTLSPKRCWPRARIDIASLPLPGRIVACVSFRFSFRSPCFDRVAVNERFSEFEFRTAERARHFACIQPKQGGPFSLFGFSKK